MAAPAIGTALAQFGQTDWTPALKTAGFAGHSGAGQQFCQRGHCRDGLVDGPGRTLAFGSGDAGVAGPDFVRRGGGPENFGGAGAGTLGVAGRAVNAGSAGIQPAPAADRAEADEFYFARGGYVTLGASRGAVGGGVPGGRRTGLS